MNLEELRKFKPQIQALAREYKIDPDSIRVFGSVARGDATDVSDVDFLVRTLPGCSLFDLAGMYADTGDLLKQSVDVAPDDSLYPYVALRVLNEAVPL